METKKEICKKIAELKKKPITLSIKKEIQKLQQKL